ncbi:Crp/Fnr family transcriptional regulator [Sphingomonas japonica]|uniref:CRP-like cAMP-binding protein n=1 Tax=Sphingomonas japonica TaxID=511662 RepID=A0ABX0TXA8_9SPHN|nr:Crp/Fnr family transcriptional regulator [Sphingomonas japonica]NIJ22936.1 CRP-like cAMP-binding protein [Sphingomonas japonica]
MTALARRLDTPDRLEPADDTILAALPHIRRELEPGQYLVRDQGHPKYCCFLLSGFTIRHKFVGDGARQIVAINLPGDFVDLQHVLLETADHNVEALTACSVALIDAAALVDGAFASPAIGKALWRHSLVEASIFREWMANIGRRDGRARTAHLLCEVGVRRETAGLGARAQFELPMTQEQLGDALGLTAVHVNRSLRGLEAEGLIARTRRSVTVLDWNGLAAAADFDPAYLHHR